MVSKTLSVFALEEQVHSMVLYIGKKMRECSILYRANNLTTFGDDIVRTKYGNVSDKITLGNFTLNMFRSCVENLACAVHISKWTTGQHHYMISSVGEQAFNDKVGIIQCN